MAPKHRNKEQVAAADEASVKVTLDVGPARYAHIKVLAESGIFKGGNQYDKDEETVIVLSAAQRLEANGDVKILGEVDAPDEEADSE